MPQTAEAPSLVREDAPHPESYRPDLPLRSEQGDISDHPLYQEGKQEGFNEGFAEGSEERESEFENLTNRNAQLTADLATALRRVAQLEEAIQAASEDAA